MPLERIDFTVERDACTPARLDQACRCLEALWPGEALRTATPYKPGPGEQVADRLAYFRKRMATRTRWFALHGREPYPLVEHPSHAVEWGFLSITGRADVAVPAVQGITVFFPPGPAQRGERILEEVRDALGATSARRVRGPGSDGLTNPP